MLDCTHADQLINDVWESSSARVELPEEWVDFFDYRGRVSTSFNSRRQFHRFYLRQRAVAVKNGVLYPVCTKDLSRRGIGFYCGRQLFPRDQVRLLLPNEKFLEVTIVRCLRINENCYECGTEFRTSAVRPQQES